MALTFRPRNAAGALAPFYFELDARPTHAYRLNVAAVDGVMVRSHPEAQIARAIAGAGLNWTYEPLLVTVGRPKRSVCPDFLIRDDHGYAWIWEHHGMMTDSKYLSDTRDKHKFYDALDIERVEFGRSEFTALIQTSTHGTARLTDATLVNAINLINETRAA